jgi:predicted nucleic acid-binding Zn ribbon protein
MAMISSVNNLVNRVINAVKSAGGGLMEGERVEVRYIQRRIRLVERACIVCGTRFEATARRLYCSGACQQKVSYQRHREKRLAEQRARYAARKQRRPAPGAE